MVDSIEASREISKIRLDPSPAFGMRRARYIINRKVPNNAQARTFRRREGRRAAQGAAAAGIGPALSRQKVIIPPYGQRHHHRRHR